ncbi:MAG: hydrolase, partial [Microlunatus sp.]|nr:hydrolase [Microlunatus sp.]
MTTTLGGSTIVAIDTPEGPGRWHLDRTEDTRAVLALGHGAGGGVTAADLALLARRLPTEGVTVARFEQPWRFAGRKVAVPPARLDLAWSLAMRWLGDQPWAVGLPLLAGGRSAGARVACRTADALGVAGLLCLAFPLHPPGRPDRTRLPELLAPSAPRVVVQGTPAPVGSAAALAPALDPT